MDEPLDEDILTALALGDLPAAHYLYTRLPPSPESILSFPLEEIP